MEISDLEENNNSCLYNQLYFSFCSCVSCCCYLFVCALWILDTKFLDQDGLKLPV